MKIFLIIIVVLAGLFLLTVISSNNPGGRIGGFGIIIAFGLWAGIKAIWNYKSEDEENTDIHQLDKNS